MVAPSWGDGEETGVVALVFNDFYANSAQLLAIVVLALIWQSGYFDKLRTKEFPEKWWRWSRTKVRWYSAGVSAVIFADMALCLMVLAGLPADSPGWRITVGTGVAVALGTLFFRILSKIWGWDDDLPEQIEKLADLKAKGILKDEEFENKKAELLARM